MWHASNVLFMVALLFSASVESAAPVEGDCLAGYPWFSAKKLSASSRVACRDTPLQQESIKRWGTQFEQNAGVVVFPASSQDAATVVQMLNKAPSTLDWAFVSGGHGEVNATSAKDFSIDMSWLNQTTVVKNFRVRQGLTGFWAFFGGGEISRSYTAIKYQGGARWGDVNQATAGSGFAAISARMSSVGVGGYSTGGGIGFLASAYGFASDRLLQVEVVLPNGDLVLATKTNKYSDLFFALRGGNGNFGIVTTFWQEAVPEPPSAGFAAYPVSPENKTQARADVVRFFEENEDPLASLNYVFIYTTDNTTASIREAIVAQHFQAPASAHQADFNTSFTPYLGSVPFEMVPQTHVTYAELPGAAIDASFPEGFRRGFYGPPVPSIDTDFLEKAGLRFEQYINDLVAQGESPITSTWTLQYLFPGMNGNLPACDTESAWPHARSGHQTLFSPAWLRAENDQIIENATIDFNDLAFAQQGRNGIGLTDYINYISPPTQVKNGRKGWTGRRYWGENVPRLEHIKEKYDPSCLFHSGPTFGSKGCSAKNLDTVFY